MTFACRLSGIAPSLCPMDAGRSEVHARIMRKAGIDQQQIKGKGIDTVMHTVLVFLEKQLATYNAKRYSYRR